MITALNLTAGKNAKLFKLEIIGEKSYLAI